MLGLVVLSPSLIGLVALLGARLPLAPRLVVRDAGRHRGRSAPAMAAVLAAVSGSAALLLVVAATADRDRRAYMPVLPRGTAGVSLVEDRHGAGGGAPEVDVRPAAEVRAAVERHLPVRESTVVRRLADCSVVRCQQANLVEPPANACPPGVAREAARADWRCAEAKAPGPLEYLLLPDIQVGGAALLTRLYDVREPRARAVLDRGGVAAFDRRLVRDGQVTVEVLERGPDARPGQVVRLPAVHVKGGTAPETGALLSPVAAARLDLEVVPGLVLFELEREPTQAEEDAVNAALGAAGTKGLLTVERGYESVYRLGLLGLMLAAAVVTLGAAGIATGLAQADARADHATLAAVGADPGLRRRLSGLQALLIAGMGTALGIAVGFVPGAALVGALSSLKLTVPWAQLLFLLVGVPLLAAGGAWLFTPARLTLERRVRA